MLSLTQLAAADDKTLFLEPKKEGVGADTQLSKLSQLKVGDIISGLITLALIVAAVIFFFMLVIGGVRWIASGGDKAQTEAARGQITAALIGLVIVFAAWAIAQILGTFFDINILNFTLPNITQ
jgi:hypothetical protein